MGEMFRKRKKRFAIAKRNYTYSLFTFTYSFTKIPNARFVNSEKWIGKSKNPERFRIRDFLLAGDEGFERGGPTGSLREPDWNCCEGSNPATTKIGKRKNLQLSLEVSCLAGDEGFEPSQTESESGVLPLHKSPSNKNYYTTKSQNVNIFFRKIWKFLYRTFWYENQM